jgi:hypothetical protein
MVLFAAMTTISVTEAGLVLYLLGAIMHFIGENFGLIEFQQGLHQ